jgi:hypothetical protein
MQIDAFNTHVDFLTAYFLVVKASKCQDPHNMEAAVKCCFEGRIVHGAGLLSFQLLKDSVTMIENFDRVEHCAKQQGRGVS